ncbi:domain found in IF2B/IF5-domain-containing protein [Neohortaea acidophila]|uniref:Domain found in IF2B/IF5-domain-containing protein n=1 Tax=Neohortaea acidophila TaxID=245834 RepID=A0A6A6PN67_9PEZI|nr:domain found in IF2B/IF5-domain-containing protein [Neohortaea acidophila]KAF2481266.1 domain found in IF2B/IF5-domain-containing protein [Neohortaea acidophila]
MAQINIRRDVTDPFYRYKMERLQSKIEGKGNGIKTVIVNLSNVADNLARPPSYVIKYFGFELGAQTNIDPKDDRWIINGAHEASKLQDYLDGFIGKFVLCKDCKNPETVVQVKDASITLDCKACGQRTQADMRHKLSSFILKNQPKKGKKDKSTKKAERRARKEAERHGDEDGANGNGHPSPGDSGSDGADENGDVGDDAGSDDELTRKINEGAKDLPSEAGQEQDVQWSVDMSEEAVKARQKALPDDLKQTLVLDDDHEDGEGGGKTAYDELGDWIDDQAKELGGVNKISDVDVFKKAKELGIETKHRTPTVLAMSLFDDTIAKQIEARASFLRSIIGKSEKHEKAFMGGLERLVGELHPALIPTVSKILLPLYQEDIIEEEVLKAWGSKASKKYVDLATSRKVRKSAEPFLEWLETAESDDDDDEDDE